MAIRAVMATATGMTVSIEATERDRTWAENIKRKAKNTKQRVGD